MKLPTLVERALHQERVNFVITNRVPRRILTRFMGWFSRIEQPLVRDLSIALFGPVTLRRVTRLYCRNERAIVHARLGDTDETVALVAVGAILVGSIQLSFFDRPLALSYRGPDRLYCRQTFHKGDEVGYFHHGSTVIVIATPGLALREDLHTGEVIRMGEPLFEFSHAVCPTSSSDSRPSIDR
ncbi:MAG TPA: phosphatidylserine decarboxylase [Vicinamibacterales bacterium]|nr:phosphatidylserine decarboxylase [Vicinamibacterales bacterium]